MKTISVFDKNFSITNSKEYLLSIQVSLNGFSFLIQDLRSKQFCGLKHLPYSQPLLADDLSKELDRVLEKEPLANAAFSQVRLLFNTSKATLIPAPLFDTEKLKSYFEFNIELQDNEAIYYHKVKNIGSYIAYAIPSDVATICGQYFPNIQFYCQSQPLIESAMQLQQSGTGNRVYLHVCDQFFDIILVNKGRLQLYNSFKYSNPADFTYFVLNIFHQFKLNPENIPVQLSGNIDKLSEEYFGISKYIRNIPFSAPYSEESFTRAFIDKDLHIFSALTEVCKCE